MTTVFRTAAVIALLTGAATAAATTLAGCEADESAPKRPRVASPLGPDEKAKQNAEQRELEAPKRELPTGGGAEFPGQSRANPNPADPPVILADVTTTQPAADPRNLANLHNNYTRDYYHGPLPHLPENPSSIPLAGSTPVPGTPWSVENSWGQVLQLQNYPHRAWPESKTQYGGINVLHNPPYYFNLQEQLPVPQNDGTPGGNLISTAYEFPWFFGNTAALPVLMVLQPPLAQVHTNQPSYDPIYHGYLPAEGPIVPSPVPGIIRWEYSFTSKTPAGDHSTTQPYLESGATPGVDTLPPPAASQPASNP